MKRQRIIVEERAVIDCKTKHFVSIKHLVSKKLPIPYQYGQANQKKQPPPEDLCGLWPTIYLAQKVGKGLGPSKVL